MIRYNFSGKVVVVTGAGSGIGLSTAISFADAGASVVFATKSPKPEIVHLISERNYDALFLEADMSNESAVKKMFDDVIERFGKIDVLVNNAGVSKAGDLEDTSLDDWNWVMSNNLTSCFLCTKYVCPFMKKNSYGKIINVSSIAGRDKSMVLGASYTTSKTAIIGFTKHMSVELAKHNINVNAVCPSQTKTPLLDSLMTPEIEDMLLKKIPLGYIQKPIQVANLILFLSSDESSYMTGSIVDTNGGLL